MHSFLHLVVKSAKSESAAISAFSSAVTLESIPLVSYEKMCFGRHPSLVGRHWSLQREAEGIKLVYGLGSPQYPKAVQPFLHFSQFLKIVTFISIIFDMSAVKVQALASASKVHFFLNL